MELPKGKTGEQHQKSYFPSVRKDDCPFRNNNHVTDQRRYDPQNNYRGRDNRYPYPAQRGDHQTRVTHVLTLDALTKGPIPKEILATETQLRLAPPRPMIHPQRGGNMDWFCDYHQEKGKDNQHGTNQKPKREEEEETKSNKKWMDTPITFPLISTEDVLDEALIVEAEVEGYLVRRIYVDRGASVEIMFEHCRNLECRLHRSFCPSRIS
ncbi:hypothetical protein Tco_0143362 [Tanacetum coccineum]